MTANHADAATAKVHRLQPLRVLLSGRDRRFLRVTSFLLAIRGYDVQDTSPRKTLEAVERHRADVVLLETGPSRTIAARKIAALQALATAPSVLLVVDSDNDDEERGWQGLPAVKKWTPIDSLVAQIETAANNRPTPLTEIERAYK
jgi:CheY-like chemotaxis protein